MALTPCPECGNPCAQDAPACPKCGAPKPGAAVLPTPRPWRWHTTLVLILFIAGVATWLFGTYHVVQSKEGTRLVRKVHFTLAESFVSLDAITSQPMLTAKAKYPLAIQALQRDGILESDQQRQQRLDAEFQQEMEKVERQTRRMLSGH